MFLKLMNGKGFKIAKCFFNFMKKIKIQKNKNNKKKSLEILWGKKENINVTVLIDP